MSVGFRPRFSVARCCCPRDAGTPITLTVNPRWWGGWFIDPVSGDECRNTTPDLDGGILFFGGLVDDPDGINDTVFHFTNGHMVFLDVQVPQGTVLTSAEIHMSPIAGDFFPGLPWDEGDNAKPEYSFNSLVNTPLVG